MGVPKFFRYMSERYPCLSEVIKEYQIPEFDNLYLDMNGIIHNCSHPNDNDPHFRISEKQIFQDIFHYIEILFRMIQPKQLFFMAIDGVAPRAKMNQQRGRRFRSAKEMEMLEEKAKEKGEVLPTEKRFDSNCITPGTPFMCRLHQQLRYFVKLKMSTDKLWRNVKVILSGHETPGEGEHKIMDYIRFMKSKPDYNPNMRHCLYGLDADLIMLGLCTHEPYFSLLREEVKFNTKSNKGGSQILTPEETKFFLLHLSLMRDYLELEFSKLKAPGVLPFTFNIENIVDDWVLMGFLIGNDFIPNLPDLHIINGALPLLYKVYEEVLPTLEGYINEAGQLNLKRFEKFMQKLASFDFEQFREKYADIQYLESKTGKKFSDVFHKKDKAQKDIDPDLAALIKATDDDFDCDNGDEEVLNYNDYEEYYYSDEDDEWRTNFFSEFSQHKTDYYRYKLDYEKVTNDVLRDQAECYIRAIQWNLHYYYNGCVSWSWYYPHHYAPYISDIKDFSNMNLTFEMGEPFLPFQQLLAVLPAASKELLPKPYRNLMTSKSSVIVDYYPVEFETDLNGKKQDWEAVVLIPFIDEKRLIEAMDDVEFLLTDEERARNRHGPMLVYGYTNEHLGIWEAPEYFPCIQENHALEKSLWRTEIYVFPSELNKGLCKNVNMNLYRTHFPTLKHLNFSHKIEAAKVKVFQQPSRGESIILTLENTNQRNLEQVAKIILGKNIYINYPHPIEVKVWAVSSKDQRIFIDKNMRFIFEKPSKDISDRFKLSSNSITEDHFTKLGIKIGKIEFLVFGQPVEGRKYYFEAKGKVSQKRTYIRTTVVYAFQTIIWNLHRPIDGPKYKNIDEIFYHGCQCFTLSNPYYGSDGTVISTVKDENSFVKLSLKVQQEPDLSDLVHMKDSINYSYMPAYTVASKLSISPLLLSRFTGAIFILADAENNAKKRNIGLNIKFSKKNEEVVGFTRRDELTKKWFYTEKVVQLIKDYMEKFPEVFDFLKDHASDDLYLRDDVFPQNGEERVTEIVNWLKEQPHFKAEVRSCGASIVDDKIVELIEQSTETCDRTEKRMTLLVKPDKLYIPKSTLDKVCPDPDTKFELFDRVVNIRDSYTVPLGYRGTVIGITKGETDYDTMCDVVFDKPFPHGVKIRCSEFRGYRMPVQGMINLSYGERLNGHNNSFRKNAVKSKERGSTYTNALKHNLYDEVSNNFYKENSPPPQSPYNAGLKFSRSNSQQASPYRANNSSSMVSQQSSNTISKQSPENNMISQHSSPYVTNSNPNLSRKNMKSPLQNSRNIQSELFSNTVITSDNKSIHKPIDKESRRIFSVSTFPTPVAQKSKLPTGGMSFFGHPNLLDIPETKNKLFTSDLGINKTDMPESCNKEQDCNIPINEDTSLNTLDNDTVQSADSKLLPNTSSSSDNIGQQCTSKMSGNIVNFIPSISQIVQQNNITAKTDFQSTESPFKDLIYSKASSCQPKNVVSNRSNESRLSTSLSQLLFKNSSMYQNVNDISTSSLSSNVQTKNDDFERAVTALALQSPLLLEEKNSEVPMNTLDLSFDEKHGIVTDNKVPTITTAMRKVTKSFTGDIEDEEEEVMTIEIEETMKQLNQTEDANKANIPPPVDHVQAFFANLNINKSSLPSKSLENIQPLKPIETNSSNVADITENTIHDFLTNAAAVRRENLEAGEKSEKNEDYVTKSDQLKRGKDVTDVTPESNANVNDLLKKMLNINTTCSTSRQEEKSVNDILQSETRSFTTSKPETSNAVHQKAPSAFTLVKPKETALVAPKETLSLEQENTKLSSAKSTSLLRPLATTFIPSQVQKRMHSQTTTSSLETGFPHRSQFNFPQPHQQIQKADAKVVPGNSNAHGSISSYQNVYTSQHPREDNAHLRRDMNAHPRGIPILGSQPNHYNNQQRLPPHPYYYQNQSHYQPMYYSGVPLQQLPQSTHLQQGLQVVPQSKQYMQQPRHQNQIASNNMPLQPTFPRPVPQTKQNFWPSQSSLQQNTSSQFLPYTQPLDRSQQYLLTQPPSSVYAQPLSQQSSNFVETPSQQYSAPNFNQITKSQIIDAPQQFQTATIFSQPESSCGVSSSTSVVEERTDSFILKLLKLTQVHKLGVPKYSYEVDDKKWFTATVCIAHALSDIIFRGKPCLEKSDSAEICARRAYNELSHTYPVTAKPTAKVSASDNNIPVSQPEQNQSLQNKTSQTPISTDETKPILKKPKKSVMAAKFNVPFKCSK